MACKEWELEEEEQEGERRGVTERLRPVTRQLVLNEVWINEDLLNGDVGRT